MHPLPEFLGMTLKTAFKAGIRVQKPLKNTASRLRGNDLEGIMQRSDLLIVLSRSSHYIHVTDRVKMI